MSNVNYDILDKFPNIKVGDKYVRRSTWATIFYPDDLFDINGLINFLKMNHLSAYISPCHDMDSDEDGVLKKPHYHVMMSYVSSRGAQVVFYHLWDLFELGVIAGLVPISSRRAYARYLIHKDDLDKYQYPSDMVVSVGELENYSNFLTDENLDSLSNIIGFVLANDIYYYCDLVDMMNANGSLDLLRKNAKIINDYINSRRLKKGFRK